MTISKKLYAKHFIEMQNSTINLILLFFLNTIAKSIKLFSEKNIIKQNICREKFLQACQYIKG